MLYMHIDYLAMTWFWFFCCFILFYYILIWIHFTYWNVFVQNAFHFSPTITLCLYLVSSYRVGLDVSIALEFRTSRTSGVLLAVSNQGNDGLGLEIVDGKVHNTHLWLSRTKYSVYSKYRIRRSLWLEKNSRDCTEFFHLCWLNASSWGDQQVVQRLNMQTPLTFGQSFLTDWSAVNLCYCLIYKCRKIANTLQSILVTLHQWEQFVCDMSHNKFPVVRHTEGLYWTGCQMLPLPY